MKRLALGAAVALLLVLGACTPEQTDVWCRTQSLADVKFSRQSVDGLTPADRRKYLRIFEEGARICGWRPGR